MLQCQELVTLWNPFLSSRYFPQQVYFPRDSMSLSTREISHNSKSQVSTTEHRRCLKGFKLLCSHAETRDFHVYRKMFIFGMGFVGQYLAAQLKQKGWQISGTCQDETKKIKLEENGYKMIVFNADDCKNQLMLSDLEKDICEATHIISSIPPFLIGEGDPVISCVGQLLQQATLKGKLCWAGYLSSTSVYGHWDGNWVDEDCHVNPRDQMAIARLAAEKLWINWGSNAGISTQVFRLGGIYGPGRSALNTLLKQKQLSRRQRLRELQRYTSRVHVADVCQAVLASIEMPSLGRIYNVVDDDPTPRAKVFEFAQLLLEKRHLISDKMECTMEEKNMQPFNFTKIKEKRVSNKRLKEELKVKLLFPSYKSGLESILQDLEGVHNLCNSSENF